MSSNSFPRFSPWNLPAHKLPQAQWRLPSSPPPQDPCPKYSRIFFEDTDPYLYIAYEHSDHETPTLDVSWCAIKRPLSYTKARVCLACALVLPLLESGKHGLRLELTIPEFAQYAPTFSREAFVQQLLWGAISIPTIDAMLSLGFFHNPTPGAQLQIDPDCGGLILPWARDHFEIQARVPKR